MRFSNFVAAAVLAKTALCQQAYGGPSTTPAPLEYHLYGQDNVYPTASPQSSQTPPLSGQTPPDDEFTQVGKWIIQIVVWILQMVVWILRKAFWWLASTTFGKRLQCAVTRLSSTVASSFYDCADTLGGTIRRQLGALGRGHGGLVHWETVPSWHPKIFSSLSVSACSASTVTSYVPIHPPIVPDVTTTVFVTKTALETVTGLVREPSSATAVGPTFFYTADDGTTSWLNGSPTATSRITLKTTVTVQPSPATSTAGANGTSTGEGVETTTRVTFRQTVHQTVTEAITLTTTPGPGTSGWNATTSVTAGPTGVAPSNATIVVSGTAYTWHFPPASTASSSPVLSTANTASQGAPTSSSSLVVNVTGLTSTSTAPITVNTSISSSIVNVTGLTSTFSASATFGSSSIVPSSSTQVYGSPSYAVPSYGAPPSTFSVVTTASGVLSSSRAPDTPVTTWTTTPTANTTSTALPTPSLCGESGNFTINASANQPEFTGCDRWDDTPNFIPSNGTGPEYPPVFNPYHHMFYAQGYGYVPPPDVAFAPVSQPHLAIYSPEIARDITSSPNGGTVRPGEIGAGPRNSISAFWFDAFSVFLGCENEGPDDCEMTISGYTYDAAYEYQEVLAVEQVVSLPPCTRGLLKCNLRPVELSREFRGLSGIRFEARLANGEEASAFLLDNMSMGWADNSCAAGLLRQRSRK
ncbi:hypothetical protein H2199_000607 [Coniosporium tulheliwenetii]|uniref:Uncharacterized protein n=1 Tax=Coniosporium tulheliwenetii TaxID=3383036 RepID=A0ACC2ZM86_9PEZI|nr:hypothetical protein H2199_000607 [Cladosporium sp. JES 115]